MSASPFFIGNRARDRSHTQIHAAQRAASRTGRAHGRFWRLGHAAALRLATRRAPSRAQGVRHVRCLAYAGNRRPRRRQPRVARVRAREQRRPSAATGQSFVLLPAQSRRRRARRSNRVFFCRGLVPAGRQRWHRRQGLCVVDRAARRARTQSYADGTPRSRDHRRAGAAGARQSLCGATRFAGRGRGSRLFQCCAYG